MVRPADTRRNWPLVVIAGAVIAVPMGIALVQDLGGPQPPSPEEYRLAVPVADTVEGVVAIAEEPEFGSWQRPAMDQRFFGEVLLAGGAERPGLTGPLQGAAFGQSREQTEAAAPALFRDLPHEGADMWAEFNGIGNRLSAILIAFPDDGSALRILTTAWGEPSIEHDPDLGSTHRRWRALGSNVMATLNELGGRALVVFEPIVPGEP
jgi:hypothetical protein